jgi:hypothetical protein
MATKAATKSPAPKRKTNVVKAKKDVAASYNKFKMFGGKQYTGMAIGRSHKWYYDKGTWKEKKITPDTWQIHYEVTKRRAGKAPEGSGAAVGTGYHWYILADQHVVKMDANSYTTELSGLKFKLAHMRAGTDKWSLSEKGRRKKLIKLLQNMIKELEEEVENPEELEHPENVTPELHIEAEKAP